MVRRGSTVRVRQRALQKRRMSARFLVQAPVSLAHPPLAQQILDALNATVELGSPLDQIHKGERIRRHATQVEKPAERARPPQLQIQDSVILSPRARADRECVTQSAGRVRL